MTSWYGQSTTSGQMRRMRRGFRILGGHLQRDMAKRPWLYVGWALLYIPIRLVVEVIA